MSMKMCKKGLRNECSANHTVEEEGVLYDRSLAHNNLSAHGDCDANWWQRRTTLA